MEVLLLADVKDLGAEGDVVRVSAGYLRNYLLPKKLAAPVTEVTKRRLALIRKEREEKLKADLDVCRQRAQKLAGVSCTITVKAGEDNKLFGSVTAANIADALKAQGVEVDRHAILLSAPIRELGVVDVKIRLHPEVEATVKVWIVEE